MDTAALSAIKTVRQRYLFLLAGVDIPASAHSIVAPAAAAWDDWVAAILARQTWDPASPEHGNILGEPLTPAQFTFDKYYFNPLLPLAIAWRNPVSRHSQSPAVLERILAALRFGERFIRPGRPHDGAWIRWDVSFPTQICQFLLLLGDAMPLDLRQLFAEDLALMPSNVFTLDRLKGITRPPITSGTNNLEMLFTGFLRGLAFDDPQWLDTVHTQVPIAMSRASSSEGLQADWSYQFHGHGINAAYGLGTLITQARWLFLTQDTPWQLPDQLRDLHVGMVREFFARNMWRGRVAPYSIDRGIAIPGSLYAHEYLITALLGLITDLPAPDKAVFAATTADYLSSLQPDGSPTPLSNCELPTGFLLTRVTLPIPADPRIIGGIRYYPESEYLLTRQPNWFAAVRMSSGRTKRWNSMLGMHTQGSSSGEFSIAFMIDGREFDHLTIPTMNWKRLMGVTRCDTIEPPPESYGQSAFCGGLAGDELAVLGLQYLLAPAGQQTLRANKSLFVTPDALVLLGSQIRCDAAEPVVTTLFHAPLIIDCPYRRDATDLDVTRDSIIELKAGETLWLRNVSIRLLTDAQLIIETRRGCYADLNMAERLTTDPKLREQYLTVHERRWIYIVVNHGIRPTNGRYGAIITAGKLTEFKIQHDDDHHRIDVGQTGGEVRFPGDWRKIVGCSYWGAEQHQWGSIARWAGNDLEITAPRRFVAAENSSTEIFLPDGFEQEGVTLKTYEGRPFPPNIMSTSANGKVHKFRAHRRGHCQVYTLQAGKVTRLSPPGYFIQPMINRAGDAIIFWGSELGETGFNIWRHDGSLKKLTDDRAVNGHPFWSADGRQIVYFHCADTDWRMSEQFNLGRTPRNIWIMDRDGQNRRQLTTGNFVDERPCISPDGQTVVFVSDRSGHMNLWSVDVTTGKLRQLFRHDGLDYRPIFSPTGDRLAFFTTNNPTGARNLCIMDWATGKTQFPICAGNFAWVHGPFWLADGQTLLVHAGLDNKTGIWRFHLPDQHLERIILPGFSDYAHGTTDGQQAVLAFDSHDSRNL